jgi:hypothetical protein
VLILTPDCYIREWVAVEIVTSHLHSVHVVMAEVDGCLPPDAAFNQQLEASVMALKQMLQHRLLSEVFLPTRARGFAEVRNVASGMCPETFFVTFLLLGVCNLVG